MGTRTILNLVLAAVVLALAWLAFTGKSGHAPTPGLPVTDLSAAAVETIQIDSDGHPTVALVRDGDRWRVITPFKASADPFRVGALLGLATALSDKGFRAEGNDLSQYGLEPPRATVRFGERVLHLGITDPVENRRYVLAGDQVHLLEDRWFSQVFGEPAAWLDPRPLAGATDLTDIVLPDAHWTFTGGDWRRTPPGAHPGADAGLRLAQAWLNARALSVRAMDPDLPWSQTVTITRDGETRPVAFTLAVTRDAVFLGNVDLKIQYQFLPRQGSLLLGQGPAPAK